MQYYEGLNIFYTQQPNMHQLHVLCTYLLGTSKPRPSGTPSITANFSMAHAGQAYPGTVHTSMACPDTAHPSVAHPSTAARPSMAHPA